MIIKEKDGSMWFNVAPWWMFMRKYDRKDKGKAYPVQRKNIHKYAKWCVRKLKVVLGRPLAEGERLSTTHMYMNKKQVQALDKYIDPMSWLDLSPSVDDSVPTGWVKITKALEER